MRRSNCFTHAVAACTIAAWASKGHAQPVLTAAGGPAPGSIITMVELSGLPALCTGPGCVWDFTTWVTGNSHQVQLVAPAAAPGGASFPTATVAALTNGNPNVSFLRLEPGYLRTVGMYNGQVVPYTDPLDVLVYPCTYQTTWTDAYAYPGNQGTRTYFADGYGTFIGPAGTMDHVLKVHSAYTTLDTVVGENHFTATMDESTFWHPGIPWPVATTYWARVYTNGQLAQEQRVGSVIQEIVSGMEDVAGTDGIARLYPNPAGEHAWVLLEGEWDGPISVFIHDATGKMVRTERSFVQDGKVSVSLSGLNKGMYLMVLQGTGSSAKVLFLRVHEQ
jgi:hypothetical protein